MKDQQEIARRLLKLVKNSQYKIKVTGNKIYYSNGDKVVEINLFNNSVQNSRTAINR